MCLSYDVSMNSLSSLDVDLYAVAVPVIANQYFTVTIKSPKTDTQHRLPLLLSLTRDGTPNQTNNNEKPSDRKGCK